jgi:hypothetical protein
VPGMDASRNGMDESRNGMDGALRFWSLK